MNPNPNTEPARAGPTLWPADFLWGVATAAHQIEGNNLGSDYWLLEHLATTNFVEPSGDCCDSWQRWPEDHALVAGLGLNAYRFSVEWARIEPEEGAFSQAALDTYRRQCDSLRERGISPVVTLHHFSSPRWLAACGGWEDAATPDRFARYCERVAHALGDRVAVYCTLNEPNAQLNSYILRGDRPGGDEAPITAAAKRALGSERFGSYFMGDSYRVRDVCIQAHALAVQALAAVAPQIPSGITLALQALECGEGGEALYNKLFEKARRPFYEAAARDAFVGVQTYMRFRTGLAGYLPPPAGVEIDRWGHDASPDVLEAAVREAARCTGTAVYVTEHGINTDDDAQRLRHLQASLPGLQRCIADGIRVLGYTHWSLLDNFEWRSGYAQKFGLYSVDRQSFERRAKPSAAGYRDIVCKLRAG